MVLKITPTVLKISPHDTEHPHGTQDTPHGTEHPHGTQDIPHGTHDIPHGTEHPPRYCTHITQGECETYVSVNSKPDHPPGKTPGQFFDRRIPHPPGKKEFKTPTPWPIKMS